jgi:hypothetical protein
VVVCAYSLHCVCLCVRVCACMCVCVRHLQTDPGFIPRLCVKDRSSHVKKIELASTETQAALVLAHYLPSLLPKGSTVTAVDMPGDVLVLIVQLTAAVETPDLWRAMGTALNTAAAHMATTAAALEALTPDELPHGTLESLVKM